ncbi:MAG: FAD-dependent oxidoreductase [Actinomycetaceae bacterium]|nr:FAD-dependent oxidoreductase [Actinomycetaceae bacterium]
MGSEGDAVRAVVVGAGVAGLAAAHRLVRDGYCVTVLEAGDRPGGMVAPLVIAGREIDGGAEAYARRLGVVDQLCAELGLEVAAPTGRPLIRWPDGRSWPGADGVLGVPASADDPALLAALDEGEMATARAEPELGDEVGAEAATVGELVEARLGRAVVDRLVAPLTRSVYRMEPGQMPLERFAPTLRGPGSLYAKVAAARGARPVLAQPVGGMFRLVRALADGVRDGGGELRLGVRVERIEPAGDIEGAERVGRVQRAGDIEPAEGIERAAPAWRVMADGEAIRADRVVLACPAREAVQLLGQAGVEASASPTGASASAVLALDAADLAGVPACSGVLLGGPIPGLAARSLTHYSAKWPWSRDGGIEFLRLGYEPGAEVTKEQALADAGTLLGCHPRRALGFAVVRWPAIPRGLAPKARAALAGSLPPGLTVAGAWVAGNGIEAAIASGLEAAA